MRRLPQTSHALRRNREHPGRRNIRAMRGRRGGTCTEGNLSRRAAQCLEIQDFPLWRDPDEPSGLDTMRGPDAPGNGIRRADSGYSPQGLDPWFGCGFRRVWWRGAVLRGGLGFPCPVPLASGFAGAPCVGTVGSRGPVVGCDAAQHLVHGFADHGGLEEHQRFQVSREDEQVHSKFACRSGCGCGNATALRCVRWTLVNGRVMAI